MMTINSHTEKAFCGQHPTAGWIEPGKECKRCKWLKDNGYSESAKLATCGRFTGLRWQWGLHPEPWRICQVCWSPKAQHDDRRVTEYLPEPSEIRYATTHKNMVQALDEVMGEFAWSATIPRARIQLILETYRNV
ncbi:hypothetical protein HWB51_gp076 [Mycobacterium phage Cuke]|uniref:Uncharacterized protein n=1 Tax=Mycobacterium phage Cuke TaxID=2079417 RepID=A0A2L1IX44_9CAUD|nr:hypothetical protein HWB51_gp076 [Mycobacterium phage Cuke]AVD99736.1 hypothetical protein SEA_CUKE_120 [Mycobacterium phage Cuke]